MYKLRSIALVVFLLTSTPALAEAAPEAGRIMDLEARWSQLFQDGDLDGVMGLMAEDSVLIMPGAPPVVGVEGLRAATAAMLASDAKVSWKSDFAFVSASGDMAYDYGAATTVMPDGSTVTGYYLVVWVKEDGQWKVAADMFN
jgi:uncharacterized protein (TIGR02246 family)